MVNNCTFIGRLGKDPEVKTSQGGTTFCNFSLAVDKGGKKEEGAKPLWLNVTCFGKTADFVGTYLKKGNLAYIAGELQIEEYTPKDAPGTTRQSIKILANVVKGLERKADGAASAGASAATASAAGKTTDDDIPF